MSHVMILTRRNPRVLMLLTAIFVGMIVLAAGSALRDSIAELFAGKSAEPAVYPGSLDYKTTTNGLFGCELENVTYLSYHTADSIAKVAAFYEQRGFTVIRDDSIKTCCISKMSYVLSDAKKSSNVHVTLEEPWFDEENHFMRDTHIVVASAPKPEKGVLRRK